MSELPLSPYDSCRLLSVNLVKVVRNPFTSAADIDWQLFEKNVRLAVRMMDNIVSMEVTKIKEILYKIEQDTESVNTKSVEYNLWKTILYNTKRGRRLGTSIIGHADLLAMLGISYDSEEGYAIIEELHKKFRDYAYAESVQLAKERGPFPAYNYETEKNNPFLKRLPKELRKEMKKYGRRNIALLTIPPAGSLAIILRTTSGIEPLFSAYYNRRRKVNPDNDDRIDSVDEAGDSWQEYNVVHPGLQRWYEHTYMGTEHLPINELSTEQLDEIVKQSPYYGSTANEIDPIFKTKLQGMVQKYIDHSISTTYNLPEDTGTETISELYFAAWEAGTKGCTVYREGSRAGILTNTKKDDKKNGFTYTDAPKRPRILPCDIHHPTIHGDKYVVLVGLYNGKPYEVMAFKADDLSVPAAIRTGSVIKQRSMVYNLANEEGDIVVEDLISKFGTPEWDVLTRMTSTALRHGADINFVVEQLKKSSGSVVDISKVMARTLKRYVIVQEITKGKPCPECGDPLILEGGCEQCINPECGYGKCD